MSRGGQRADVTLGMAALDKASGGVWQAEHVTTQEGLGQHLSVEGETRGHDVWLRILQTPPDWAGVGRLLHASTGEFEDLW